MILRLILRPKNRTPNNPPYAPKPYQSRRAKRTFPLPPDIIRLVSKYSGYISIGAYCSEEDPEITHAVAGGETEEREADEPDDGVENDDGTADAHLIGVVGLGEHYDGGGGVGGSDEALGFGEGETHSVAETEMAFSIKSFIPVLVVTYMIGKKYAIA